jgi:hypothetical protein
VKKESEEKKPGITLKQPGIITLGFFVVKQPPACKLMRVMARSRVPYVVVCHFIVFARTGHDFK